jgi:hypothetical protein
VTQAENDRFKALETRAKAVTDEIGRLQKILDTDPLGNPQDPEEEWAIYAMLDWSDDIVRLEEAYRGAVAEKVFNSLPRHPFEPTPDSDDE